MGMGGGGNPSDIRSEINVTPLVDVVLVLLIIFMVVTPELQRGKEVKLPLAEAAKQNQDGGDPLIVSIKSDRSVYVEQDAVTLETLPDQIKDIGERRVLIKGDAGLTYGDVKGLIDAIRKGGAKGVSLGAATPEGK